MAQVVQAAAMPKIMPAEQLARLLKKIAPETRAQKKQRLAGMAANAVKGKDSESKAPPVIKYGLNHVTQLVEDNKVPLF